MFARRSPLGIRGIGDTSCPSDEQLAGIQDCSDPCQAPYPPCVSASAAPVTAGSDTSPAAFAAQCAAGGGTLNAAGSACTYPTSASSNSIWLIGGAALFVVLLLGMKR